MHGADAHLRGARVGELDETVGVGGDLKADPAEAARHSALAAGGESAPTRPPAATPAFSEGVTNSQQAFKVSLRPM